MKKITEGLLKAMRACKGGVEAFNKLFPGGMTVNLPNCRIACLHSDDLDVQWFAVAAMGDRCLLSREVAKEALNDYIVEVDKNNESSFGEEFPKGRRWKRAIEREAKLLHKALKLLPEPGAKKKSKKKQKAK